MKIPERDMSRDEMQETARRWIKAWCGGDTRIIDELHSVDFIDHSPSGRSSDNQGFKQGITDLYKAFPDFAGEADDILVDEQACKVTVRWTASGTHRGGFGGVKATGRPIGFHGIEILAMRDGRITERWGEWDFQEIINQMMRSGVDPQCSMSGP